MNAPEHPAGISLCMIVKNEARFLEKALRSVQNVVDEIIVVDTGSTDGTQDIARRFGARVESRTWCDDFAWARNEALALATRRWILVLDADEVLNPGFSDALRAFAATPRQMRGLWIQCNNLREECAPRRISNVNAIVRIFPNDARVKYAGTVHEFIALDGATPLPADASPFTITHFGYTDEMMVARGKAQRNYLLSMRERDTNPEDPFARYNLAMAALHLRRKDETITELEAMRRLADGTPYAYVPPGLTVLAELHLEKFATAKALELCSEVLAMAPDFPNAHFARGNVYAALGRTVQARESFAAAYELAQATSNSTFDVEIRSWKAANAIGATFVCEERYAEARAWFDLAIEVGESVALVHLNRARSIERLGEIESASAAYELAFRRFADEACTVEYVNFLLRHKQTVRALAVIEQAASFLENDARLTLLGSAAAIVIRQGEPEDRAAGYIRRALATGASFEEAAAHLETLYMRFGDSTALALMRRVAAESRLGQRTGLRLSAKLA